LDKGEKQHNTDNLQVLSREAHRNESYASREKDKGKDSSG
jgi:hypothetical protein